MRLFQWTLLRRFGSFKKVTRPDGFKIVERPRDVGLSLSKMVDARIQAGGPITIADYMKMVLTNPDAGYYMKKQVFGRDGDFVTSPEISQLFGEIVAVWIVHELSKIGNPRPLQLVELGPGLGTLMSDVLRCLRYFKETRDVSVHMVEVSHQLAIVQCQKLCDDIVLTIGGTPDLQGTPFYKSGTTPDGIPVHWYNRIEDVPKAFSVVLAHEFFDALPIHKYQKTDDGWREVLIDSKRDDKNEAKFQYVLSPKETPISKLLIRKDETREHVEISPETGRIARHIAGRLVEDGGFALFVDYGHNGEKSDTFRAFKKHKLHDPLVDPGTADLTADVDFSMFKTVMADKMFTVGPVEQGDFLLRLGIKTRLGNLSKQANESQRKELESGYHMIVDKDQMGARYKCFAAFPLVLKEHLEKFPVAGFFDLKSR